MAIAKSELTYNVIITNTGSNYAYKLLDYQWVTVGGTDVRYWMAIPGNVRTGEFVPTGDAESVTTFTDKYITEGFDKKWVKDDRFKHGDFLVSKDHGHVFLYTKTDGSEKVWRLDGGENTFQSNLASRELEYGTLIKLKRGWSGKDASYENLTDISK